MEPMKQCPQCGKYVPADRTYCMSCGVTLGVRCPDCHAVSPVGSKICADCGHSFVQKKKLFHFPLRDTLKKYAKPLLFALPIVLLILALVAAGAPTVLLRQTVDGRVVLSHELTGHELMGHFLSGDPASITSLLGVYELRDIRPAVQTLLFGMGAGWLFLLAGLALSICLLSCNLKRMGRETGRRMFFPLGLSLFGAVLFFVSGRITTAVLADVLAVKTSLDALVVWKTMAVFPLIMLIASSVAMLLQIILYVDMFRHVNTAGELGLSRIFYIPVAALGRLLRKLFRRIFRKKAKDNAKDDEPYLAVTHRFSSYLILFGVALIFTQALLSKISNIFFWFIFFLPIVMLVYVLLSARALSVQMRTGTVTTEKNTPHTYEFRIDNHSILAMPFIEARVSIPQSNSVRCTERLVRLSMAPLTGYTMKNTVTFRFRGTYDIGVRYFYVYDFFRLFRVRVDIESMTTVYVMPRRLTPDDALAQAISDSTVRTVRAPLVVDKLEVSDIRDYRSGDSLKSIHWKLSSKSETFVVKDYNTGTANQTVIYCDLAPHFPDEPPAKPEPEPISRKERRAARKAALREKDDEDKLEADRKLKKSIRIKENADTHDISDEELSKRLQDRAAAADLVDSGNPNAPRQTADTASGIPLLTGTKKTPVDVHELSSPLYYEDMNEYLADGVVELTIALVLSELRQGHEVLLLWFDRRSDTGISAYSLRGVEEFESIYHLFGTAPLCDPEDTRVVADHNVTSLTAMTGHLQSAKQLFVVPTMDTAMLEGLSSLPGVADAGNAGSTEVVLYTPEERFKYPVERTSYLEGCREQLAAHGVSLTAGAFHINAPVENTAKGGDGHEA